MTDIEALEWGLWLIKITAVMKADRPKKDQCVATLEALLAEKKSNGAG